MHRLEGHYRITQTSSSPSSAASSTCCRPTANNAKAALKIAVEMAAGQITRDEAIARIEPASLDQLLHPTIDPRAERDIITKGLPASPGAATGIIEFDPDEAERRGAARAVDREAVILVREETKPEDIQACMRRGVSWTARERPATPPWWRAAWAGLAYPAPATCGSMRRPGPSPCAAAPSRSAT